MHARKKSGAPSRSIVLGLAVMGLVVLFLPRNWTSSLMSAVQVIVPFQDAAGHGLDATGKAMFDAPPSEGAARRDEAEQRLAALQHVIGALSTRVNDLEAENERLIGTRWWSPEGFAFGSNGMLIPAKVISADLLPWRSSRLLNAGTVQGVDRESPVITRAFSVSVGENVGVQPGMAILLRESLIGFVEDVGTHTSRVKLFSDVTTKRSVQIGRVTDEGITIRQRYFWLTGKGRGRMEIGDVMRRTVDEGDIAPGDLVLLPAIDSGLPTAMCVGHIESFEVDRDNPLLARLHITARIDEDDLHRVYVYQPDVVTKHQP
ncbi:MAG: rod shape-determining protein MreC [Planctomycetota bacterium]|jgi:cell shape-determining protein MreC